MALSACLHLCLSVLLCGFFCISPAQSLTENWEGSCGEGSCDPCGLTATACTWPVNPRAKSGRWRHKVARTPGLQQIWVYGNMGGMKTTVEIPDELFRAAKATAARDGSKLKDLVADGLRLVLRKTRPERRRLRFPLIPGKPEGARLTAARVNEIEAAEDREETSRHARPGRR